jgi:hypothetical protein
MLWVRPAKRLDLEVFEGGIAAAIGLFRYIPLERP